MKLVNRFFKLLIVFACTVFSTAAFGQVTQVFDGHSLSILPLPAITNIDIATNYVGGVAPNAGAGDTAEFDGLLHGPLSLGYNGNWQSGPGQSGLNLYLTGNQTNSISIDNLTQATAPPNFAFNNITLDAGAGALTIGDDTFLFNYAGRPGGAIHTLLNNSSNLVTIGAGFHMVAGSGSPFTFDFAGTGNFLIKTLLVTDNTPNNNTTFTVDTSGTVTWTPTPIPVNSYLNAVAAVNVNNGLLIMTTNHPKIGNTPVNINNGTLRFNAPGASQTISGVINGSGVLQVSNGTLTLSGQSGFFGTNLLSGGTLVVNSAENAGAGTGPLGSSSIISFAGGTLAYTVNNAFDYSPRFDTSAGQVYKIDTAGQVVTFATPLTSVGGSLTKLGAGTLTLAAANTYTGPTTVSVGKLVIQRLSGTGAITVADGAALGITENDSQIKPSALNLGSTAGVTLEFNNVTNTTTPSLQASAISSAGTVNININSGTFGAIGQSYPLFSWTSGSAPAVTLGSISGAAGSLSTNGNSIVLTITSTPYVWTGVGSGSWDTTSSGNWVQSGNPVTFANGVLALFDDTATGNHNISISGVVQPTSITLDNDTTTYNITSSAGNIIGGNTSLTKNGVNVLTLSGGANTNTGAITFNEGTVSVGVLANGGSPSDIGASSNGAASVVFNGGTLQYTGPAVDIDRNFTLGSSGAIIDASGTGALRLTNTATAALGGSGPRTITLTGTLPDTNTLAVAIVNSSGGATALTKSGPGTWILTGSNTYSGLTTINNGLLQVGDGGASGTVGTGGVENNHGLDFNRTGTVIVSGAITGTGAVTNDGPGTAILAGNNSYSGGTVINAGTIQIGNGGGTGTLNTGSRVIDNGTIIFNTTGLVTISGFGADITGTGNVRVQAGKLKATGNNTYTGWTLIDPGATFQPSDGNAGTFAGLGSTITNNGTLFITRQDAAVFGITNNIVGSGKVVIDTPNANSGQVNLAGTNTYTGNTWIGGSALVLGDGLTTGAGTITGTVIFTNTTSSTTANSSQSKRLLFNHPEDFVFANNIISRVTDGSSSLNSGSLEQMGPGIVTITGNNDYIGNTTIDTNMTLIVGNGGNGGTLGAGTNGVIMGDSTTLVFNRAGAVTIGGPITGNGVVNQIGSGTVILAASNTVAGDMSISNGTLVVNGAVGNINVAGGTLAIGSISTPATLFAANALNISSGKILMTVNKSLVQSNSFIMAGQVNYTGGTLVVTNPGPSLTVGDKFVLFPQPISNGHLMPITSTYATFQNNLETDGSITVTTVQQPAPPTFKGPVLLNGTNIVLSATNNFGQGGTFTLYGTNNLAAPLANWPVITNGQFDQSGQLFITNTVKNGPFFYYLRQP
jgi:fibronectin-binding autotransporter adhesin